MITTPKKYPALYAWLAEHGLDLRWLSEVTGIPYNSLHDRLKNRVRIKEADIDAICTATGMTRAELTAGEIR